MGFDDFLYVGLTVLVFGTLLMVSYYGLGQLQGGVLDQSHAAQGDSTQHITAGLATVASLDWVTVFVAFGLSLVIFAGAFYIGSHPFYALVSFFLAFVWFLFTPQLSNAFLGMIQSSVLNSVADKFPYTVWVIFNFPLWSWLLGILSSIVFYGKPSNMSAETM